MVTSIGYLGGLRRFALKARNLGPKAQNRHIFKFSHIISETVGRRAKRTKI